MVPHRNQRAGLRQNLLQHLARIDRVLAALVPMSAEATAEREEPWLVPLFQKRQGLQVRLCEVERQIERHRA